MRGAFADTLIDAGCVTPIPARVYAPAAPGRRPPLVLHLRGCAFQRCWDAAGGLVAGLLAEAGAVAISPDYPTGREHPFPVALEAMFALLQALYRERGRYAGRHCRLFVAGEEAGGNLAAALAMMARDRRGPPLAGQLLLAPMLDAGMATCSIRTAEAGPVGCKWADGWRGYLGSPGNASHPYAAPGSALRLAGLPPALILTAEDDPMRDESLAYAARLRASGIAVRDIALAAPTGWPDALGRQALPEPAWGGAVRAAFAAFFTQDTAADTAAAPPACPSAMRSRA
jgi:acetyl esterase/lipase